MIHPQSRSTIKTVCDLICQNPFKPFMLYRKTETQHKREKRKTDFKVSIYKSY